MKKLLRKWLGIEPVNVIRLEAGKRTTLLFTVTRDADMEGLEMLDFGDLDVDAVILLPEGVTLHKAIQQ